MRGLSGVVTTLLMVGGLAGCQCNPSTAPTVEAPTCEAPPEVAFAELTEHRTPLAIPPEEIAIATAKDLKDVVFTHARTPENPWAISHAMLAIGPDVELTNGKQAIDWLFSEYAETFEVCGETFIRFPRSETKGEQTIRIEPHSDLILKALTEHGVPPEREVTVEGKTLTVGHLYRGSLHRAWVDSSANPGGEGLPEGRSPTWDVVSFGPPGKDGTASSGSETSNWNDAPWALQGLSAYAPDALTWTAEGDRSMSIDRFTHAMVDRIDAETQSLQIDQKAGRPFDKQGAARAGGLVSMTCGGAHALQGTAHALGRGFGEDGDRERFRAQIDILFWRYASELETYNQMLQTQPKYRTVIMMQRLKFLGHFLETTHKLAMLGLFRPSEEEARIMQDASVQLIATVAVLERTGILSNLDKMIDPATPELYPGLMTNEQLYLDYVGDSAHAYRGLDLALGHGVYRF